MNNLRRVALLVVAIIMAIAAIVVAALVLLIPRTDDPAPTPIPCPRPGEAVPKGVFPRLPEDVVEALEIELVPNYELQGTKLYLFLGPSA